MLGLGSVRQLGALLIERALGRYPTTLETDEALLREDDVARVEEATASLRQDVRVRWCITIRRDEKVVLRWWQRLFRHGIALAGEHGADTKMRRQAGDQKELAMSAAERNGEHVQLIASAVNREDQAASMMAKREGAHQEF